MTVKGSLNLRESFLGDEKTLFDVALRNFLDFYFDGTKSIKIIEVYTEKWFL